LTFVGKSAIPKSAKYANCDLIHKSARPTYGFPNTGTCMSVCIYLCFYIFIYDKNFWKLFSTL